jgi:mono/diheme cytochrome c family protein
MKSGVLRWLARGVGGLLGLLAIAAGVVYAWSETVLRRHYEAEPEPLVQAPPELVAQGHRLARLHGCLSCHGDGLVGNHVFES